MPNNSSTALEPALRFGGLGGLLTITGIYAYYAMGVEAFANTTYGLVIFGLLFLINTSMAIGASLMRKRTLGGVLPFKDAVAQTFVTLGIIVVFYHVFYFLLLNVFDPTLLDRLTDIRLDQLKALKESGDIEKETFEQQKTVTQNSELSLLDTFWLTLVWLVLSFLYALILSAFLRREPESAG